MDKNNIKSAVRKEILRIAVFCFCYFALIAIGILILYGTYLYSRFLITDFFLRDQDFVFNIFVALTIPWSFAICISLGFYLVKPLFSFRSNADELCVEVDEEECPELFNLVRDVAVEVNCKLPKHIYLTPRPNAAVFYNYNFWSIFFPVRKNLEIGLCLFDGMSVDEIKSIIGHECGHFSQNSMKVGSTVYIANKVLYDLIYVEDWFTNFLGKWVKTNFFFSFPAVCVQYIIYGIRKFLYHIYKFVQKGNLKLSRYMEFDADSYSCKVVDRKTVISSLCKVDVIERQYSLYDHMLRSLVEENKLNLNYFKGKDFLFKNITYCNMPYLKYDEMLSEPVPDFYQTEVVYYDIWSSHPSLEDRITNINNSDCKVEENKDKRPAWNLVPDNIADMVSDNFYSKIREGNNGIKYITDDEYEEWVKNEKEQNFSDETLFPYYGDYIFFFDLEYDNVPQENPINNENTRKLKEFRGLLKDLNLLVDIQKGANDIKEVKFRGRIYSRKKLPIETLIKRRDILFKEVQSIYNKAFAYVCSRISEKEKTLYDKSFRQLFYCETVMNSDFGDLMLHRNAIVDAVNCSNNLPETSYYELCSQISKYEEHFDNFIEHFIFDVLDDYNIIMKYDYQSYIQNKHNSSYFYNNDEFARLIEMTDYLGSLINTVIYTARKTILRITKEAIER